MSDARMRRIASWWHSGMWSALYAFSSTGTILSSLRAEIRTCIEESDIYTDRVELLDLLEYVIEHEGENNESPQT